MTNYFYTDANGQKQGPVDEQRLRELAAQGIIGPHTSMETDGGHKGSAGQIPGLFPFPAAAPSPPPRPVPVPPPVSKQLFCTNCGKPVSEQAVACLSCGAKPTGHRKFCRYCAAALNAEQIICVQCGAKIATGAFSTLRSIGESTVTGTKSKVAAGLLGILLGGLGAHKFYLGSWGWGLLFLINIFVIVPLTALLSLTVILAPLFMLSATAAFAQGIIGFIEGIIYLCMSDEAFAAKYSTETQSAFRW